MMANPSFSFLYYMDQKKSNHTVDNYLQEQAETSVLYPIEQ